jgi:murein L,D-transpeptidase YcbB/YkuD
MRKFGMRRGRAGLAVCALLLMTTAGCHAKRRTRSAPKSEAYADALKPLVQSKQIKVMHWPNFAEYEPMVEQFYNDRNYEVAWVEDNGSPSKQATAFIEAFKNADKKGLIPEDYDASLWDARVKKLSGKNDDDVATFDAAMTVNVMRFISDLRIGRVNPTHFNFDINTDDKKYDLPTFVSDNAVDAADVPTLIGTVEPDNEQYRALEAALPGYLAQLNPPVSPVPASATPDAAAGASGAPAKPQKPLPVVFQSIKVGGTYIAANDLAQRLEEDGDLAAGSAALWPAGKTGDYNQQLADGVKQYQAKHRLSANGMLTLMTILSLNHQKQAPAMTMAAAAAPAVPPVDPNLRAEIQKIDDSLERWRWLPNEYVNAPLVVNLPEFVLRGYNPDKSLSFTMKVVVGKVVGEHQTPVFTHEMKYVIFRPFWNVPTSIIKKELMAHIAKSGVGYLASHNFETVDSHGEHVDATAAEVERGGVVVRQKPGPKNSLGLIKFMFPNEYNIYLHSTPEPLLFDRSRRDFSHGCVRVQKPADLAVWVLNRGNAAPGDWDMQKVTDAMQTGPDNHTVSLKNNIPIVIFYLTAHVGEDGQVHFFNDLYNYDKQLEDVLSKGRPYPQEQVKVDPNAVATPADTD